MKPKKHPKPTPEEALRNACGEKMGLDLTYSEIKDRLDTTEIARVGQVRQTAKSARIPTQTPAPRRAAPAVLLVLAVLILTPALAVGSFLIARSTMDPTPPVDTGSFDPDDTDPLQGLIPGRPADSETTIVAPRPIAPNTSDEKWSNLFNLSESYATDNAIFLRAEHLDPAMTDGSLPAVLTISDVEEWKSFCGEFCTDGVPSQELLDGVNGMTWEFFKNQSLQVIVTEGRSGSIRYSLEETYTAIGKVHRAWELVAQVPLALTMDIVHWCIVIPVSKAEAQVPVVLSMRDIYETDAGYVVDPDSTIPDIVITDPYQLWFESDSYAQNGCLYGRLGYNSDWSYLYTKSVNTLAEWQSLYRGCSDCYDESFLPQLNTLDEAFFAKKSLLILYVEEGSGSYRHRVDEVAVKDGTLHITLTTLYHEMDTCDMAAWAILVPIDKAYGGLPVELVTRQKPDLPHVKTGSGYQYGDTLHANVFNDEALDQYSFPKGQTVDSVATYHEAVRPLDDPEMPAELRTAMNSFDEAFFEEKSLLILYLENEPDAVHYEIDTLTVQDGWLHVGVYSVYPEEGDGPSLPGSGYRVILIPVDKELANLRVVVYTLK